MPEQKTQERSNVVNLQERNVSEIDDMLLTRPGSVTTSQVGGQTKRRFASDKLEESFKVTARNEADMQRLVAGLNDKILSLGMTVQRAAKYQGFTENVFGILGSVSKTCKVEADILRQERLKHLNTEQAMNEILRIVNFGIKELGISEKEYDSKKTLAETAITMLLKKNADNTPIYLAAKARRQQLEPQVQELEDELKSGTVDPGERPEKEHKLEDLTRQLNAAANEESAAYKKAKEASDALPERQKERKAAEGVIVSMHTMRLGLREKYENYASMLETSATTIRAQARIGMYEGVDAAFNVAAEKELENEVAVAGGALETAAQRSKIMAINADASKRMRDQLRAHMDAAKASLDESERDFATGSRAIVDKMPDAPATSNNGNGADEPQPGAGLEKVDD